MKILFIAPRFHTNQVEMVRVLKNQGHHVRFFVSLIGHTEDHTDLKPLVLEESRLSRVLRKCFGDGGVNQRRFFPAVINFYRLMGEFNPDVVIIRIHGFAFTYLSAFFARLIGSRVIFYQQVNPQVLRKLFRGGVRGFLRKINFSFRLFLFEASWMTPLPEPHNAAGRLPRRCYFIPFALPIANEEKIHNTSVNFLVVGKYQKRKNQLLLLEAASKLADFYDFRITFVGEVSTPEHSAMRCIVEDAVLTSGLRDRVVFLDNAPYKRMFELYRSHDVFVLPASHEPASISILEALGQGLPVVCSDSCGTKNYIRDGLSGFIFSSDDVESLRNIMVRFLSDPNLCVLMSKEASKAAKNCIAPEVFYGRFMAMLADVKS